MDQKKTIRPFSMKDKIGYTLGDLGCCFTEQYRAMYLSIFYTLILQVNPFHVGILLLITKIWDAVNDPIIGAIVDSRKATKGGNSSAEATFAYTVKSDEAEKPWKDVEAKYSIYELVDAPQDGDVVLLYNPNSGKAVTATDPNGNARNLSGDAETPTNGYIAIDIADVDVGRNVGAQLQMDQAEADRRIAQAKAEERRAMAVAHEQEMIAAVQEMRAKVVEAEAEVPKAMAEALRNGKLGVMDYYQMQNTIADTTMRDSIAKASAPQQTLPGTDKK